MLLKSLTESAMTLDDHAYYHGRAEAELTAAATSGHPAAVRAHYLLAGFYLDLVHRVGAVGHAEARAPIADGPFLLSTSQG
jgi:hypothetical protein